MRTLLMLCLVALITGCSKDNDSIDETPKDVEIHFYAYTKHKGFIDWITTNW